MIDSLGSYTNLSLFTQTGVRRRLLNLRLTRTYLNHHANRSPLSLCTEYYIVFSVCGFSNALVIWLFFPETAGVSCPALRLRRCSILTMFYPGFT
jgi:hypothetical protein